MSALDIVRISFKYSSHREISSYSSYSLGDGYHHYVTAINGIATEWILIACDYTIHYDQAGYHYYI